MVRKEATNVMKKPGKDVQIEAKTGSAAVSKNLKAALKTIPDFKNFFHTVKDSISKRLYRFSIIKMPTTKLYPSAPLEPDLFS